MNKKLGFIVSTNILIGTLFGLWLIAPKFTKSKTMEATVGGRENSANLKASLATPNAQFLGKIENQPQPPITSAPVVFTPRPGAPWTMHQSEIFSKTSQLLFREKIGGTSQKDWVSYFEKNSVRFEKPIYRINGGTMRTHLKGFGVDVFSGIEMRFVKDADTNTEVLEGLSFNLEGGKEAMDSAFEKVKSEIPNQRFNLSKSLPTAREYNSFEGYTLVILWVPTDAEGRPWDATNFDPEQPEIGQEGVGMISVTLTSDHLHL
jgi:hypothetical protein